MNVLALDVATITGWCVSKEDHGVWNLKPKRDESRGMRLVKFEAKLKEAIDKYDIELVSYERVAGAHQSSTNVASEMIGVLKKFCESRSIQYTAYSAMTLKKFGAGHGHASKNDMIEAARKKYGYKGFSDDEADAIHLFFYTHKELNL